MCGIAGFLDSNISKQERYKRAEEMISSLRHRGPDDQGVWMHPDGLTFVHTRLSIIDLSPNAHQPKTSTSKRYTITYNGEIYNFSDLKKQLEDLGHNFKGHSDTEVILHCLDEWGVKTSLQKFVGMFAIAIWDNAEKQLYLSRDAMGEKPLFFGWNEGRFFFSSELKPMLKYPGFQAKVNVSALGNFLRTSKVAAPLSIIDGISKVMPGRFVKLNPLSPAKECIEESYWDLAQYAKPFNNRVYSDAEVLNDFEKRLTDVLERQMFSDVPLGAFLSGGVDSSAVVAMMQKISNQPINTFTIGFESGDFDEAKHAKDVAQHLGTNHTEMILTGKEVQDVAYKMPDIYDEPFSDSSQIPTYLLSKMTKQHVSVSLSGDGGDELFCGYVRYQFADKFNKVNQKLPRFLKALLPSSMGMLTEGSWNEIYSLLNPLIPNSYKIDAFGSKIYKAKELIKLNSETEIYSRLISNWYFEPIVKNHKIHLDNIFSPEVEQLSFIEKMMYSDSIDYLPNDIMVKVDRASMAVSLETRAPFLDRQLVEWVWSLPLHYKLRGATTKWMLRELLYKYVPKNLIERPKTGFAVPLAEWLRGDLKPWAEDLLSESSLSHSGYLDVKEVKKKWNEHCNHDANWHHHIWSVLMFEDWCRKYNITA